jgi:hypothetical protein
VTGAGVNGVVLLNHYLKVLYATGSFYATLQWMYSTSHTASSYCDSSGNLQLSTSVTSAAVVITTGSLQLVDGASSGNRVRFACDSSSDLILSYPDASVTANNSTATFSTIEVSLVYYDVLKLTCSVGPGTGTIMVSSAGNMYLYASPSSGQGPGGGATGYTTLVCAGAYVQGAASLTGSSSALTVDGPVNCASVVPSNGYSGTITLAKLTTLGTNGSLTVVSGIVTAYTAPT